MSEAAPSAAPQPAPAAPNIPNYLWQSIVVTILCCLPFGIPAIVYASKVNTALVQGNVAAAQEASAKAKFWCWMAFGFGLAAVLVGVVAQLVGIGLMGVAASQ